MNAPAPHIQFQQAPSPYTREFLEALAAECKRSMDIWNASAGRRDGAVGESFRARALEYTSIYWSALSALEGCPASIAELSDYFEHDHLLLWRDVAEKAA